MNSYVKELVKLSNIDKELDAFVPQIEAINKKVEASAKKLNELLVKKDELTKLIEENSIKIASYEKQIEETKKQLEDIKKKSAEVKNEKEAAALSTEEQIAKDKIIFANEEIERYNKINDNKKAELEALEEEIKKTEQEYEVTSKQAQEEMKKIEEEKALLHQKRVEIARNMDPRILSFYEKIRVWAGNTAVVKVENQACYGCYMKINDKVYNDLIIGEEIVTCPHCGRVLYIEKEEQEV